MQEDFRIEMEDRCWHPWVVYMRLHPCGFLERLAEKFGWRRELWLQVFSADTLEDVTHFIHGKMLPQVE